MNNNSLKPFLRQNARRKNGLPGSYSVRLLWQYSKKKKSRRIERGLGTNIESEALARAAILLRFIYSLGHRVSNRIQVSRRNGSPVPLHEALPKPDAGWNDLPLFANLSPFANVETGASKR